MSESFWNFRPLPFSTALSNQPLLQLLQNERLLAPVLQICPSFESLSGYYSKITYYVLSYPRIVGTRDGLFLGFSKEPLAGHTRILRLFCSELTRRTKNFVPLGAFHENACQRPFKENFFSHSF